MDPDETLSQLRALATKRDTAINHRDWDEERNIAVLMADLWDELDEWLSKGGFLPKSWERD